MTDKPLSGRVAVVTGASRGIGHAVALALAEAGAHVVAVARTVGGLEELDDAVRAVGGSATLVPMDLRELDQIDQLGAALHQRYGRIDALVGNAGVLGELTPLGHTEQKMWDEVMTVNVTVNWRLIRSFEPLLKASDAGRAVFLSSTVARAHRAYWGAYAVSKAALECLVGTWAEELKITAVKANVINPGPLRTKMREKAMPGEDPATLAPPAALAPHVVGMVSPGYQLSGRLFDFRTKATTALSA